MLSVVCGSVSKIGREWMSWEHVWPPKMPNDSRLTEAMIGVVSRSSAEELRRILVRLEDSTGGLDGQRSLVADLVEKSGEISAPFVELALADLSERAQDGGAAVAVKFFEPVLLTRVGAGGDETDQAAAELYQGCVWELLAMTTTLLLAGDDRAVPASSFLSLDRRRFVENKIMISGDKIRDFS
jgi:hypothetical protein